MNAQQLKQLEDDLWSAATAQLHQLTLVTRNTPDFDACGIDLLNPFSDRG